MKSKVFSILRYNKFEFGDQTVSQFVLFECKFLFSIIFFYFHKSNGEQDRYHTHAFKSFSIKLWGRYYEYVLKKKSPETFYVQQRTQVFKYFQRGSYHKIGNSNGCATILLSGPWKKEWEEFKFGHTTKYTWGRKNKKNRQR